VLPDAAAWTRADVELRTAAETGRYETEGWRVRRDGTRFWASVVLSPIQDSDGVVQGYVKVVRDLTERLMQEVALRGFEQMIDSISDYEIIRLDPEGAVRSWNPGARRLRHPGRNRQRRHLTHHSRQAHRHGRRRLPEQAVRHRPAARGAEKAIVDTELLREPNRDGPRLAAPASCRERVNELFENGPRIAATLLVFEPHGRQDHAEEDRQQGQAGAEDERGFGAGRTCGKNSVGIHSGPPRPCPGVSPPLRYAAVRRPAQPAGCALRVDSAVSGGTRRSAPLGGFPPPRR